jgi:hypothetical protein
VENLWTLLSWNIIQRAFKTRAPSLKSSGRDIILEELFVHDVDDGRDQGFDVLGVGNERVDIPCKLVSTLLSKNFGDGTYDY